MLREIMYFSRGLFFVFVLVSPSTQKLLNEDTCGTRNEELLKNVHNLTDYSQPWMVKLMIKYPGQNDQICSGTIITPRHILTASHCFVDLPDEHVNLTTVGHNSIVVKEQKLVHGKRVFRHPEYRNDDVLMGDVAILEVAEPFKYNDNVRPICIAGPQPPKDLTEKEVLLALGFGMTSAANHTTMLRAANFIVKPDSDCESHLNGTVFAKYPGQNYCTYPKINDVCVGDSGGPLIRVVNGKRVQIGVLNGLYTECGEMGARQYLKVHTVYDWILSVINTK